MRRGVKIEFIDLLLIDRNKTSIFLESYYSDSSREMMGRRQATRQIDHRLKCTCLEKAQTTMKSLCNSLLFSDSLKELKNLSTQLYSAAMYFELSYTNDGNTQFSMVIKMCSTYVTLPSISPPTTVPSLCLQSLKMSSLTTSEKPEAEKALRGDLQPEQAPSSATKTGILPTTPWTLMKQIHQAWLRKRRVASAPLVQQVQQTINPT